MAASALLLLVCTSALSQTSEQTSSNLPKSFHDGALNITYFYPGRFTADTHIPTAAPDRPQCAHSTLFANSVTPTGTSSFVLSTIDNTCPNVMQGAASNLGAFVREQIIRQLGQYGTAAVTQEPTSYAIDGHPASIVVASVPMPPLPDNHLPRTTYAAKVCMFGTVPEKPRKRGQKPEPPRHILCFDFTTPHSDLMSLLFAFSMQFDNNSPLPIIPGSVIR